MCWFTVHMQAKYIFWIVGVVLEFFFSTVCTFANHQIHFGLFFLLIWISVIFSKFVSAKCKSEFYNCFSRLNAVFEVDTDLQKDVRLKITAEMSWPSILSSPRHLNFPLTNTNSSSVSYFSDSVILTSVSNCIDGNVNLKKKFFLNRKKKFF